MTRRTFGAFLLCLVALTTVAMLCSFTPAKAASSNIRVETINGFIVYSRGFYLPYPVGTYGIYNIVGEVLNNNTGTMAADHVNVTASFVRYSDGFLGKSTAQTYLQCILKGQKAPFRLAFANSTAQDVVNYHILNIDFAPSSNKTLNLQISNSTYYVKDGLMQTPGTVRNNGADTATGTQAVVTYYNKTDDTILWTSRGIVTSSSSSTSENITSGQTIRFEVTSNPLKISLGACNFAIVAESKEYLSNAFTSPITQDTTKPTIEEPILTTTSPTPTQTVGMNVTVTKPDYTSKVSKVLLYYKVGRGNWQTRNMKSYGNLWRNYTNTAGAGQTVTYYFQAFDDAGNTQTSPFYTYTVQGQPAGVPVEYLLIAFIALILVIVVYRYRKRIF